MIATADNGLLTVVLDGLGLDDSFPGGHANEFTPIFGLRPLVADVLTRRNRVRLVLEVLCALVVVGALAASVRVGDHRPSDNLGGFLIGAATVLIARGIARAPGLHDRCRGCPAQLREGAAANATGGSS